MTEKIETAQAKLYDLLYEQRQLLSTFLLLTREQTQLIADEDGEAIEGNLGQRQAIIRQVDDLQTQITPLWQIHANSPAKAGGLSDLQEEIGSILRAVTEIDKRNQQVVRERIDFLRGQMRRVSATFHGVGTYIKGTQTFSPGYVDERQ